MATLQQLFDYARLADASYIDLSSTAWQNNPDAVANTAVNQSRLPRDLARDTFNTAPGGWQVVGYDDSQNPTTGFAASLFKNTEGKYVLAMRGTESGSQTPIDLLKADLKEIGYIGLALSQTVSMVNWILRLQAPAGGNGVLQFDLRISTDLAQPVMPSNVIGPPMGKPGAWFWLDPRYEYDGRGLGVLPLGTKIDVTGHSLGGHLAGLMTRLFPGLVSEAVIFNAPGFDPATAGAVASATTGTILGTILGALGPAQQLTDETMDMFRRYMPAVGDWFGGVTSIEGLFRASSRSDPSSMEHLVVGLERLLVNPAARTDLPIAEAGTGFPPYIESGDFAARSAWYARWKTIEDALTTGGLSGLPGQVRIAPSHDWLRAQTDVAALLSLTTGATFSLRLIDPSPTSPASLALYGAQRTSYERWLADINHRAVEPYAEYRGGLNFSSIYLSARAAHLNTLAKVNVNNESGGFVNDATMTKRMTFEDWATDTTVIAQPGSGMVPEQRFVFGGSGFDFILGNTRSEQVPGQGLDAYDNFNEYLFGGDNSDEIQGQAGRDWIEGNAGNDYALIGGAGHDMVWGGEGDDTLYVDAGLGNGDGLYGGRGFDTYVFERGATQNGIFDSDGKGQIIYGAAQLVGGNGLLSQSSGNTKIFQSPGINRVAAGGSSRRIGEGNHWRFRDIRPIGIARTLA